MNRVFNEFGIFHFVSQSFEPAGKSASERSSADELVRRISTVIIDEDESDSFTVRVDSKGFHPSNVAVRKVRASFCTVKALFTIFRFCRNILLAGKCVYWDDQFEFDLLSELKNNDYFGRDQYYLRYMYIRHNVHFWTTFNLMRLSIFSLIFYAI